MGEIAQVEGRAPPEVSLTKSLARTTAQDNKAARDELLRIASRATESVKNLQAGVSAAGRDASSLSSSLGDRGRLLGHISGISAASGALASKDANHDVRPIRAGNNILGDAQRVLEKMETISAQRDPSSGIS